MSVDSASELLKKASASSTKSTEENNKKRPAKDESDNEEEEEKEKEEEEEESGSEEEESEEKKKSAKKSRPNKKDESSSEAEEDEEEEEEEESESDKKKKSPAKSGDKKDKKKKEVSSDEEASEPKRFDIRNSPPGTSLAEATKIIAKAPQRKPSCAQTLFNTRHRKTPYVNLAKEGMVCLIRMSFSKEAYAVRQAAERESDGQVINYIKKLVEDDRHPHFDLWQHTVEGYKIYATDWGVQNYLDQHSSKPEQLGPLPEQNIRMRMGLREERVMNGIRVKGTQGFPPGRKPTLTEYNKDTITLGAKTFFCSDILQSDMERVEKEKNSGGKEDKKKSSSSSGGKRKKGDESDDDKKKKKSSKSKDEKKKKSSKSGSDSSDEDAKKKKEKKKGKKEKKEDSSSESESESEKKAKKARKEKELAEEARIAKEKSEKDKKEKAAEKRREKKAEEDKNEREKLAAKVDAELEMIKSKKSGTAVEKKEEVPSVLQDMIGGDTDDEDTKKKQKTADAKKEKKVDAPPSIAPPEAQVQAAAVSSMPAAESVELDLTDISSAVATKVVASIETKNADLVKNFTTALSETLKPLVASIGNLSAKIDSVNTQTGLLTARFNNMEASMANSVTKDIQGAVKSALELPGSYAELVANIQGLNKSLTGFAKHESHDGYAAAKPAAPSANHSPPASIGVTPSSGLPYIQPPGIKKPAALGGGK